MLFEHVQMCMAVNDYNFVVLFMVVIVVFFVSCFSLKSGHSEQGHSQDSICPPWYWEQGVSVQNKIKN